MEKNKYIRGCSSQKRMQFRRRLYPRGSSHETTIPKPLLFSLDPNKRYDVVFTFDTEKCKWYVDVEERE